MHTDGFKTEIGLGASASTGNCIESASLPKFSSIFTAETYAIQLAPNTISAAKGKSFSIFTDSRSCLQALLKQFPTNPQVRKLKHTIAYLQKLGKTVELCWIPGHAGVSGNEIAYKKAKEASGRQEELIPFPYQDLFAYINDAIHQKGNTECNQKNDKVKEIKPNTRPWKKINRRRKNETVINRLKAGHTILTHVNSMEGLPVLPECELCLSHTMTVKHLLTDCKQNCS